MQHRQLGSSELTVSPICLGTMTFGVPVAEADAISLVHQALDLGINFVDTANVYEGYDRFLGSPGGVAEEIVGKALVGHRDDVVLATKVCAPVGPGPDDRGLSAAHIMREAERSLQRLQTDVIDLYWIHWPDKETPLDETLTAMDQLVQDGKVRYIAASNFNAARLCECRWIADSKDLAPVVGSQIPYSLLRREFHNDLEFCERFEIGVTPYQPLQGGLLTGKYQRGQSPPDQSRGNKKPQWLWELNDALFDQLEALEALAREIDVPMAQYALAWALQQPAMSSMIVGATRIEQVQDAVAAAEIQIPAAHLEQIDAICPPPWQQPDPIRG